jgi:hypothetical protein
MSTVGKVLIVAQLGFSLLLMAFAGAVSSVQTNYRTKWNEGKQSLKKATDELEKLRSDVQGVRTQMVAQEKTLKNNADKARGEADAAQDRIKQLETQLTQSKTELESMRSEAKIAGEEARARRDEAVAQRQINAQLHQKRDEVITANRGLTDEKVNLEQKIRSMDEKHNQVLADMATMKSFIRKKGFDADPKELAGSIEPPPVVQGIVLETTKGGRKGNELVGISLGSDAGLAKGHELFVYRAGAKGKYLGKIRLELVNYRTAVGVVVEPTKNGDIEKGDNVTSKL